MKHNSIKYGVLFLLLTTSLAVGIFVLHPSVQSQNEASKSEPKKTPRTKRDNRETFPVLQYPGLPATDEEKRKSAKYDQGLGTLPAEPDISKDLESTIALHWSVGLKALPVDKSELIVTGKVVNAKAHLSPKKTNVYSEFKIEIEDVLKNSIDGFKIKNSLSTEREGGRVKYPSGCEFWYRVPGQNMPVEGARYVFFLTENFPIYGPQKGDLYLLTAYELRDGIVFPLDNPGDDHPLSTTFNGEKEATLLDALKALLRT